MCDPVQQMAFIAETTISKEDQWWPILQARMLRRARIMRMLAFRQYRDCEAATMLKIRKEKAEADQ